jgi:hypothetical protein
VVLIACLAASVAGFRAAGRAIARFTAVAEPASADSIFSTPLHQEQVDRYLKNYRTEKGAIARVGCVLTVGAGAEKRRRSAPPAVGRDQKSARSDRANRLERRLKRERVTA